MSLMLLLTIPIITGILSILSKNKQTSTWITLLSSCLSLGLSLFIVFQPQIINEQYNWISILGSSFSLQVAGMSKMLLLLNSIAFLLVYLSIYNQEYQNHALFLGLMSLTQAGLVGVFCANDGLLFYFFWELALIPVYFLCSIWGGEKRIAVTFKFFVYTFLGSLLMLAALIFVYLKTPNHSFHFQDLKAVNLSVVEQQVCFWLFFIAFAIKMPIFPLHTWQPDAYDQSPTPVTMILSGVMVKMGIYAVAKWLMPLFPASTNQFSHIIIVLSVIGMVYASLIAIKQDNVKKLIAYSSIAHIGLMAAALFTQSRVGVEGVMIQMFNHGINVIGLWIVAHAIEQKTGAKHFSELGGIAQKAPMLTTLLVILAFANVALPLTNAFVGEFFMFNALYKYSIVMAVVAGLTIILGAVYTLTMVQKIFYGHTVSHTENLQDTTMPVNLSLILIVGMIIFFGVYPSPMFQLTTDTFSSIFLTK